MHATLWCVDALERFRRAQDAGGSYARAIEELGRGRKATHWMWWVFPQLAGLGRSETARTYAITSMDEARAYLADPVLSERLHSATATVLRHADLAAEAIFGWLDARKLHSSMTLFHRAAPDDPCFSRALDAFFGGLPDPETDRLLGTVGGSDALA